MADFDDIVSAVRTKRVILFLGAGIHYHGQNGALSYQKSDRPLLAGELADQLSGGSHWYDRFNKTDYPARMNFTRVALDYELFSEEDAAAASTGQSNSTPPTVSSQQAKAWRLNGRQRLGVEVERAVQLGRRPSPLLGLLAEMGFPIVVTTNYDTLYENSVMLQNPQAKPVVRWYQASGAQKDTSYPIGRDPDGETPYIYKLHGHIGDPDSIVATDEDYIDFVIRMTQGGHSNSPMPLRILSRMAEVPTLFIGYSLVDYNMRLLLKTLSHGRDIFSNRENGGGFGFKSYAVSKYPDPLIQRVWQDQECAIGFLAEDIWDFIPRLHAAVQSK